MTELNKDGRAKPAKPASKRGAGSRRGAKANGEMPGWTNGLRQLYDEVVDEELPEGLRNLLAQFDDGK